MVPAFHVRWLYIAISISLLYLPVAAQQKIRLRAPDGRISFSFSILNGAAYYDVHYKDQPLIVRSRLSLVFGNGPFETGFRTGRPVYREAEENYELVVGKARNIRHRFKEVIIPIQQKGKPFRQVNLVVRAFNDGLAFRYEFPRQGSDTACIIADENTSFHIHGNPLARTLILPNYTSSHEGPYTTLPLQQLPENKLMDMPMLLAFPGSIYMAITEAALLDYAGMYLSKQDGTLVSRLSPWPGDAAVKVKASLPHRSPWRVLLISDRIGDLIESNIITSLNQPCKIKDLSWIKPGKTTFPWWNGNVVPDTLIAPGNNFVTQQYYIDFCARNGLEYHSVVEYGSHQWYVDDGTGFAQPGPNADVTKPVPGLNMQEVCEYAHQKNVDIRVWVHWAALYAKLDSAFAIFEKWGISGMMVDFMDRDDQQMVNIQTEILEKAAKHHLHIQFHGANKPTGLSRTYPNEFTREGTLNYEHNKWSAEGISPDHDLDIVFTRMLAGSTDYHLGGFRAVTGEKYRAQYTRPLMLGTRCHMLAMYVVLESYLVMVCDYPEAYEGQPGFEFIKQVPATWDATKVLDAAPGKYVLIARKKNDAWYIGGITNGEARTLRADLSFLDTGNYEAIIYRDGPDVRSQPDALSELHRTVTRTDSITVQVGAGGGVAIILKKVI